MDKDTQIKSLYYDGRLNPDKPCPKCNNKVWLRGGTLLTWVCPMCGTAAYTNKSTVLKLIDKNIFKVPVNI